MENKRSERQLRRFSFQTRAAASETEDGAAQGLYVEGYAVRFDSPTVLFEYDGREYREQIDAHAFDGAVMDDVVMNYNHGGKVVARTRNHTLELRTDPAGLYIRARLDGTEEGRRLYDEIAGGYIDRMSFAFTIREESFDAEAALWTVRKVKRLYDVSAVDIPAYADTSIEARWAGLIASAEEKRKKALALQRKRLALRCRL